MNIIFLGSSQFAVPALKALAASGHKVSCVVTQPDRLKGRGLQMAATAVKRTAEELGLEVFQPQSVNSADSIKLLSGLAPDLLVVISYGQMLSQKVLDIPGVMSINAHASLLPKYRGAAPINWAIIRGEENTGITIMKIIREMDAGPLILQRSIRILREDMAATLEDKLSCLAAESLLCALTRIERNDYKLTPQDKKKSSLAPKLKKSDGEINWSKPAGEILNLIRGSIPWPGAFTHYKGKLLKIYKADIKEISEPCGAGAPGEILEVSHKGIVVASGKGNLAIEELQIEGRRRMTAEEFIAGHKISAGELLG